jgi:hypothetical protein
MGRHSDENADGRADGFDADDPQARAFHEVIDADLVDDGELTRMVATGELRVTTHDPVLAPQVWDADGWDAERDPELPRSPEGDL